MATVHDFKELLDGKKGPTFDDPFAMLTTCHDRADRALDLLDRMRTYLATHGADPQVRQAAIDIIRYFEKAAREHHRDEELHVFPPLLAGGDEEMIRTVRRLMDEHALMDQHWAPARGVLMSLAIGRITHLSDLDNATLDSFAALYGDHIDCENDVVYPAAKKVIHRSDRVHMGREMKQRRGG